MKNIVIGLVLALVAASMAAVPAAAQEEETLYCISVGPYVDSAEDVPAYIEAGGDFTVHEAIWCLAGSTGSTDVVIDEGIDDVALEARILQYRRDNLRVLRSAKTFRAQVRGFGWLSSRAKREVRWLDAHEPAACVVDEYDMYRDSVNDIGRGTANVLSALRSLNLPAMKRAGRQVDSAIDFLNIASLALSEAECP